MRKDFKVLPPDTAKVWEFLNGHALLKGFVLVGGTGLALRIQHRLSEDLDFCFNGLRLPRRRLEALVLDAEPHGITFRENDSPSAWEEFERVDMDLNDYQQDYIVNGSVKVTFFTADSP
ncbi:MAG: nucleotidyl transferase AbiEii/AbiGii toxin family protein, partial [Verrucomicrobiota bacterium]